MEPRICWFVAAAVAVLHTLQTCYYQMTPTVLMPSILKDFEASVVSGSAMVAVSRLAYVLALPGGGWLVDRWGPQRCILAAVSALGASALLFALMRSMAQFAILQAVNAVAMAFAGVPVYSVFLCHFFVEHLGTALGMVLSGFSLAGALSALVLGAIASHASWRVSAFAVAGALIVAAIPLAVWIQRVRPPGELLSGRETVNPISSAPSSRMDAVKSPASRGEEAKEPLYFAHHGRRKDAEFSELDAEVAAGAAEPAEHAHDKNLTSFSWASLPFLLLASSYFLLQYSYGSYNEHFLIYMTMDEQANLHFATTILAVLYFSTFSAKIVGGYVGDRWGRFLTMVVAAIASVLGAVLMTIFTLRDTPPDAVPQSTFHGPGLLMCLLGFAVLFGAGYGAMFNANYALVPRIVSISRLGFVQSILFAIGLCGNGAGALITGYMRTWTRHYMKPFLLTFAAVILNAACVFALARYLRKSNLRETRHSNNAG